MGAGAPAVILDTGLGGSSAEWGFVQPEVARFTRVCSYDRAGMGYSDPGPSPRTARRIASELATLVDRSGIDGRLVVAGASKSTDCASRVATSSMNSSIFAQRLRSAIDQIATSIIDAKHDHSGSSSCGWHDDLPRPIAVGLCPYCAHSKTACQVAGRKCLIILVGMAGFEPATPDPQLATVRREARLQT